MRTSYPESISINELNLFPDASFPTSAASTSKDALRRLSGRPIRPADQGFSLPEKFEPGDLAKFAQPMTALGEQRWVMPMELPRGKRPENCSSIGGRYSST